MWLSDLIVFRENNNASISLMDSCFSQIWQYRILRILLQFLFSKKSFPVNNSSLWEWYVKINQACMREHVCFYVRMKEQFWIKKRRLICRETINPLKWNFRLFASKMAKNNSTALRSTLKPKFSVSHGEDHVLLCCAVANQKVIEFSNHHSHSRLFLLI